MRLSGKLATTTLVGVGLVAGPIVAAIVALVVESSPARLSIELGLDIFFFGIFSVMARPFVLRLLSIEKADAEIAVVKAFFLAVWAAVVLIALGILNLMGIVPWK